MLGLLRRRGFGDETPCAVGMVRLPGDIRVMAQVFDRDPESLAIGHPVRLEFRRIQQDGEADILCYG